MPSSVLDLQRAALDDDKSIAMLLRMALPIASTLNTPDFTQWIRQELYGYENVEDIPQYRQLNGEFRVRTSLGDMPIAFEGASNERLYQRSLNRPISEAEELLARTKDHNHVAVNLTPKQMAQMAGIYGPFAKVYFSVPRTALASMVDAVRNTILEWTIQLVNSGILGDNMTFSDKDKEAANSTPPLSSPTTILNIVHHMENSTIQQSGSGSIQSSSISHLNIEKLQALVDRIEAALSQLEIAEPEKNDLRTDVATIRSQLQKRKPIKTVVFESFASIRNILEGAGGALAAELLKELGGTLF